MQTRIELHVSRAVAPILLLMLPVGLVVFAVAALIAAEPLQSLPFVLLLMAVLSLFAPLWFFKIILGCVTITTVPLAEAEVEERSVAEKAKKEAPRMKPKPKDGMNLDARRS